MQLERASPRYSLARRFIKLGDCDRCWSGAMVVRGDLADFPFSIAGVRALSYRTALGFLPSQDGFGPRRLEKKNFWGPNVVGQQSLGRRSDCTLGRPICKFRLRKSPVGNPRSRDAAARDRNHDQSRWSDPSHPIHRRNRLQAEPHELWHFAFAV